MRRVIAVFAALLAGCAIYHGPGQDNVAFRSSLSADSALSVAQRALEARGYTVTRYAARTLVTQPRPVPRDSGSAAPATGAQYWILRIDTDVDAVQGETRLRVSGFMLPPAQTQADSQTTARAIPVTAQNETLFREVEAVSNAVRTAIQRAS